MGMKKRNRANIQNPPHAALSELKDRRRPCTSIRARLSSSKTELAQLSVESLISKEDPPVLGRGSFHPRPAVTRS